LAIALAGVVLVVIGQGKVLGGAHGWLLLGVGSAALSGAAVTTVRAARRTDGAWAVFAAFTFVGAICIAPWAAWAWRAMTTSQWLLCLTIGLVSLAAQLAMTEALGVLDNATAGVIGNLTVLTTMTMGYLLGGERFSRLAGLGAALTILGVTLVAGSASASLRKRNS
jgi:drug/metabolite transporter (DMT)-like permease